MDQMPNIIVHQPTTTTLGFGSAIYTNQERRPLGEMGPQVGFGRTPPGLECLLNLGRMEVGEEVVIAKAVFGGCGVKNKYRFFNNQKEEMFRAMENSNCLAKLCFASRRPFDMSIKDGKGQEILRFARPLACSSCFFPCCLQKLQVFSQGGDLIGRIEQMWSWRSPKFDIKDADGNTVLKIQGPCVTYSCFDEVSFDIYSVPYGSKIGRIFKKWSGFAQEVFTDFDSFGIQCPEGLDVSVKATLLGASILIDYMYFEGRPWLGVIGGICLCSLRLAAHA